jgi:two-component system chemotaxis response regulator CheY
MATILVMDDEAPIRTWLLVALQSAGYVVVEAFNGHEGLRLYRQQPADLVIVDILMPELNGPDTIIALTREF